MAISHCLENEREGSPFMDKCQYRSQSVWSVFSSLYYSHAIISIPFQSSFLKATLIKSLKCQCFWFGSASFDTSLGSFQGRKVPNKVAVYGTSQLSAISMSPSQEREKRKKRVCFEDANKRIRIQTTSDDPCFRPVLFLVSLFLVSSLFLYSILSFGLLYLL